MSYQITQWDYGFAIRAIAGMVGHPVPVDPAGSPDPAVIQMGLAVNNALGELLAQREWQDLTVRGSIPIVADYAGQIEKGFDLPVDFLRFIDETQWSRDSFLPAPGPVPPQGWMVATIQSITPVMQLVWQIRGDQLFVLAPPYPTPVTYEFFYISKGQVIDQDNPTLLKNIATKNGDRFKLDGYLITLLARVKYLEWKGFDASAAMRDFQIVLNERAGADKGARTHDLAKPRGLPLIGACNIAGPLGGGGSVDLSNYYTKAECNALFLTEAAADALFLTQAEGDARYLTASSADALFLTPAEADAVYEPKLGLPAADGYVLSSTVAGVRSWVAMSGGGGPVAASSVTNTPAGNIAATNVQAALNELDTEKEASLGVPLANGQVLVSTTGGVRSWSARTAANTVNVPAGGIAATDVQAALNELDTKKAPIASPTFTGTASFAGIKETVVTASGTTFTPDPTTGTNFVYSTTGNATFTLPAPLAGKSFTIDIIYGGAHTVTWAGGGTIRWPGGTVPTPTSASGKRDKFAFHSTDTTNTHGATVGLNYAA